MWFSRCGISILTHDFQDMDGEPGDFTVSEGHGHPLVCNKSCNFIVSWHGFAHRKHIQIDDVDWMHIV
jgi:hypothetical protein